MTARTDGRVYPVKQRRRAGSLDLPLDQAIESYARGLAAENRSSQTIERVYVPRLRAFTKWLSTMGMPSTIEGLRREHIESYILYLQEEAPGRKHGESPGQMPATVSIAFRTLRGFFSWAIREDVLARSPMERMRAPSVPEELTQVLTAEDWSKLMKSCSGTGFEDRRDTALLLVLYDTGMRRGEVARIRVDDLEWSSNRIFLGAEASKSKRGRIAPMSRKVVRALDRYVRVRSQHPHSDEPWLWLGKRGQLGDSGILQMVERRGLSAGLQGLHPHVFRHTFAHNLKAAGVATEDVMLLGGWRDPATLARYGRGAAAERALAAYQHVAPSDRAG